MEKILKTFKNNDIEIEVVLDIENNTVWLTKEQIASLFCKSRSVISRHITALFKNNPVLAGAKQKNIAEGGTSVHFLHKSQKLNSRPPEYYNLDLITELGIRIKSQNLSVFSSWFLQTIEDIRQEVFKDKSNIIRFSNENISLDVNVSPLEDTVWLTQNQMAILYDTTQQNISVHIKNILDENELDYASTHKFFLYVAPNEKTYNYSYYNLDMILAVGYRVKSKNAIIFRKWSSKILKEYLLKGYVLNKSRTLITNENYINLVNKVNAIEIEVNELKEKEKYHLVKDMVILDGEVFDAKVLITRILDTAKNEIIVIDPYVNVGTLSFFKDVRPQIKIILITSSKAKIVQNDIDLFNSQYGNLTMFVDDRYHDRYLILDNTIFYHLGSSINYLGKRLSQITIEEDEDIKTLLRNRISDVKS